MQLKTKLWCYGIVKRSILLGSREALEGESSRQRFCCAVLTFLYLFSKIVLFMPYGVKG